MVHLHASFESGEGIFEVQLLAGSRMLTEKLSEREFRSFVDAFPDVSLGEYRIQMQGDSSAAKSYLLKILESYDAMVRKSGRFGRGRTG